MKIKFCGASGTVTGSCYYLSSNSAKILIDCGMFQGKEVTIHNYENFPFNANEIDFVILTHSHIDHSGMLPKLIRHGFKGKIYATHATIAISSVLLLDSAKIQEKELQLNGNGLIYSTQDAQETIRRFESINFFEKKKINEQIEFTLVPAGHILGAASVALIVENKSILFSGDVGRLEQSIIKNFLEYEKIDFESEYIIGESLYGNSLHEKRDNSTEELIRIIQETMKRDGNVIIPSFALHRTQELLEILKNALIREEIKKDVKIFLDSPMAISITKIYTQFQELFNDHYQYKDFLVKYYGDKLWDSSNLVIEGDNGARLRFDNLRFVRKYKKSLKLMSKNNNIIIAGSGMADGGRILHHLYSGLKVARNSIIFVGYQAEDTLGRQLVSGASSVVINNESIPVHASVHYLRGFSAHADKNDLLTWLQRSTTPKLKTVFLIHAEPQVAVDFADFLHEKGYNTLIPKHLDEFEL